jgi:hypothetical protein
VARAAIHRCEHTTVIINKIGVNCILFECKAHELGVQSTADAFKKSSNKKRSFKHKGYHENKVQIKPKPLEL